MTYSVLELKIGDPVPVPPDPRPEREIVKNWRGDKSQPLLSIICFTFQHAHFVRDSLNGLLMQQTDFPFEIIVHDDTSTDGTLEIINEYAANYPNIFRLILQEENQFSKGRWPPEFAFPAARGKYISICEGDDYWLDETKVQRQVRFLEDNPQYAVCGHDAFIFEDGRLVKHSKLPDASKRDFGSKSLQGDPAVLTLTATFVNRIAGFEPEQAHVLNLDSFLFSRLGQFGGYKYMDDLLPGAYRVHAGGVWSLLDERKKRAASINTKFWIGQYYKRKNDSALAKHYAHKVIYDMLYELEKLSVRDFFLIAYRVMRVKLVVQHPRVVKVMKAILRVLKP